MWVWVLSSREINPGNHAGPGGVDWLGRGGPLCNAGEDIEMKDAVVGSH